RSHLLRTTPTAQRAPRGPPRTRRLTRRTPPAGRRPAGARAAPACPAGTTSCSAEATDGAGETAALHRVRVGALAAPCVSGGPEPRRREAVELSWSNGIPSDARHLGSPSR